MGGIQATSRQEVARCPMGWYGLQQAILDQDVDDLVEELSPRRNPNDPGTALHIAVRQMTEAQRTEALNWADKWLRDSWHDCLRARGDPRWGAVNWAYQGLRAHIRPFANSNA